MHKLLVRPITSSRAWMGGAALMLTLLLVPGAARADSDGYYCLGSDYVAFQIRGWHWYTHGEHRLVVASLGSDGRVSRQSIDLGVDFQPHAMRCQPEGIRLEGWGNGYIRVSVGFEADGSLAVTGVERDQREFRSADFPDPLSNLGDWSRPVTVELGRTHGPPADLVIEHRAMGDARWCTEITTRLVTRGERLRSTVLYRGFRECEHGH